MALKVGNEYYYIYTERSSTVTYQFDIDIITKVISGDSIF